ncbi:MAG: DUF2163 domain-containing protein [Pseudomonadota bacterium]
MRVIPAELQAELDSGATTLARCWQINRKDGVTLGFTDHDRELTFDGITHTPRSGFTASSIEAGTGLAVDSHDVTGALSSDEIDENDLKRGLYDGAEITLHLVNWQDTSQRVVLSRGQIGAIRRSGGSFEAEVVGLSARLNRPYGRAYLHSCDCRLGDAKCGIDLQAASLQTAGTIEDVLDPNAFSVSGLQDFADDWFTSGYLTWTSGENVGVGQHVKLHRAAESVPHRLEIWLAPPLPAGVGDTFSITAGCDKTANTCRAKFSNLLNFRGFPHMPGDDAAASYPSQGGSHNGGSLFR